MGEIFLLDFVYVVATITHRRCSKHVLTRDSLRELVAAPYRDLPQSTALLSKHEPLLTRKRPRWRLPTDGSAPRISAAGLRMVTMSITAARKK